MEEQGVPDMQITIDGTPVSTKMLFPDDASRMDFHTKLKLLKSPASGEPDGAGLEQLLFGGQGAVPVPGGM